MPPGCSVWASGTCSPICDTARRWRRCGAAGITVEAIDLYEFTKIGIHAVDAGAGAQARLEFDDRCASPSFPTSTEISSRSTPVSPISKRKAAPTRSSPPATSARRARSRRRCCSGSKRSVPPASAAIPIAFSATTPRRRALRRTSSPQSTWTRRELGERWLRWLRELPFAMRIGEDDNQLLDRPRQSAQRRRAHLARRRRGDARAARRRRARDGDRLRAPAPSLRSHLARPAAGQRRLGRLAEGRRSARLLRDLHRARRAAGRSSTAACPST